MLTHEQNETLCRVGPGTPMGALLRRYWLPALLSSDLPVPAGDPHPFRLVGERLVGFRDSHGTVGVLDEMCPHRGASLALGRVEDGGIRCIYHGWKMAADGRILETPNVRSGEALGQSVCAPAYPVREAGGIVWVYLGPAAHEPPFPAYGFTSAPPAHRAVARARVDCNWVQIVENALDASHIGLLHADYHDWFFTPQDAHGDVPSGLGWGPPPDNAPVVQVGDTDFGFHYAAWRRLAESADERRVFVGAYVMPFGIVLPGNPRVQNTLKGSLWAVPADDTHTNVVTVAFDTAEPVDQETYLERLGFRSERSFAGDHLECSAENRFLQDRSRLSESSTGIEGLFLEDLALAVSQGPIQDRTREHLVADDEVLNHFRALLLDNAEAVRRGGVPRGVAPARPAEITGGHGILPVNASPWEPLVPGNLSRDQVVKR